MTGAEDAGPRAFWGPLATLGWGALLTLFISGGVPIAVAFVLLSASPGIIGDARVADGDLLAAATVGSALLGLPAIAGIAALAHGARVRDYLGLRWTGWRPVARWLGGMALLAVAYDLLARALDRPVVPPFMVEGWRTADWRALFWVAVVVAAPLVEEALFRGFFFAGLAGLAGSRFGPTFAIAIPAVVWTLLHLQYDAFDLSFVFVLGLLLGLARWRTGSLATCLIAHGLLNLGSMFEMVLLGV